MPQPCPRSYHHRHLDFDFAEGPKGTRRLTVHSAEVLRGVLDGSLGGDLAATGYKALGSVDLPEAVAAALELVLGDLRNDLRDDLHSGPEAGPVGDDAALPPGVLRQRRLRVAERLEAFFTRHRGNPLVENGVVVDPRSARGRQLVAQIRAGQAEPRLLADWVRLRIEWRGIIDAL